MATMTPEETVNAFVAAVGRKDLDAAMELLAEDVEYDNVPMPTVHGRQASRDFLEPFVGPAEQVEFLVHRQAVNGNTVLNERTDRFLLNGSWLEIPVAGVFEVADGQITLWRDYFDVGMIAGASGG